MTDEKEIKTTFNPNDHLIKLKGKDYLPVAWRLVWLRELYPDANIFTEVLQLDTEHRFCMCRARVDIPERGSATGIGSETGNDFGDFIEKSETKALGRALAALGLGTQFVGDEFNEGERIVDSPVERKAAKPAAPTVSFETLSTVIRLNNDFRALQHRSNLTKEEVDPLRVLSEAQLVERRDSLEKLIAEEKRKAVAPAGGN